MGAHISREMGLEPRHDLGRAPDGKAVEPVGSPPLVDRVGHAAQVIVGVLLDAALVVGLRPTSLFVLPAHELIEPRLLVETIGGPFEHTAVAAADQRDHPAAHLERRHQRLDARRGADGHARIRGPEQLHDLEQVVPTRAEHGQPPGPLEWRLRRGQERVDPLDVGPERDPVVVAEPVLGLDLAAGLVDQRADLGRARRRGREPLGVEVHIQADQRVVRLVIDQASCLSHCRERAHRFALTHLRRLVTAGARPR